MKVIKEEVKSYNLRYEAIDGTTFYDKGECEKYEATAAAIIRSKFLKLVVHESAEYSLFGVGSDDYTVYAVKMATPKDADVIKQLYILDHSWVLNTESQDNKHYMDEAFDMIDRAYKEKDILFVGKNFDGDTYLINTRKAMIDSLNGLDKNTKK